MRHIDWSVVTLIVCGAAVLIAIIGAVTYYNVAVTTSMTRAGLCEVFDTQQRLWSWKKCS